MRARPRTVLLSAAGAVVFLLIAFELARYLTAASHERDVVFGLLTAQARGDAGAVRSRLGDCDARCAQQVDGVVERLKRPGRPKILSYDSPTAYALTAKTANARVAWSIVARNGLPVVQCVTVRRKWSFVSGASVSLRRLSAPIGNEASCPSP